jgi:cytochrome c peroxidase
MVTTTSCKGRPWTAGISLLCLSAVGLLACDGMDRPGEVNGFTDQEWKRIMEIEPLATPAPVNRSNWLTVDDGTPEWATKNEAAAKLGQMLFFDLDFSTVIRVDGPSGAKGGLAKVGCVTCHDQNRFFIDSRTADGVSHGVAFTSRSSPTMVNMAWYEWFTWAGRLDSLSMQGANAPEALTDVATSRLFFAHVLFKKYRAEYDAVFSVPLDPALEDGHPDAARFPATGRPKAAMTDPDGDWEKMAPADRGIINRIMANVGKAYEAYERKLVSRGSDFELFVKGDFAALEERQAAGIGGGFGDARKRGLRLFIGKAACNECHSGPILSDNKLRNIGVPQIGAMVPVTDTGRFGDLPRLLGNPFRSEGEFSDDPEDGKRRLDEVRATETNGMGMALDSTRGRFRTAGLLHIAETAPYFHNGSARTLADVVRFYNRGGGDPGTYSGVKDPKMAPLNLTPAEEADLVAFLQSLTGDQPPAEWRANTAKPPLPPPTPPATP